MSKEIEQKAKELLYSYTLVNSGAITTDTLIRIMVEFAQQNAEENKALHLGSVISRLYDLEKVLYENANKNPNNLKDLFDSGKQQAYSHIYFEVKNIIKEHEIKDKGYINWKILNLILGFSLGGIFMWFALNGL